MKFKTVIMLLVIIVLVIGGLVYAVTKASDLKLPSHSDFQRMHNGGNQ